MKFRLSYIEPIQAKGSTMADWRFPLEVRRELRGLQLYSLSQEAQM